MFARRWPSWCTIDIVSSRAPYKINKSNQLWTPYLERARKAQSLWGARARVWSSLTKTLTRGRSPRLPKRSAFIYKKTSLLEMAWRIPTANGSPPRKIQPQNVIVLQRPANVVQCCRCRCRRVQITARRCSQPNTWPRQRC